MQFTKIEQPQLFKQHAYEEIKNAIINHVIPQGEILSERNLSESLGISRTPLREAIHMLELEGWVKSIPRKGVFVSHISQKDVEEVLQLRSANESLVMELLIPKITDKEDQTLEEIFMHQLNHQHDNKSFISIDKDFHMYLAELSGNDRLIQLMHNLSDLMRWFGIRAIHTTDRIQETLQEHRAIIAGVKKRDVNLAKIAVAKHIEQTRAAVLTALQASQE
ncbi:GntR family transcriptional regulator [Effusibacillus dendaii]|uniref:GntR family transcriptional regulator n=1 Tax=Effusibacillus dendaii TaxID=2743772 RepID=A0A7I8DA07_9BACL|nr:GntR family transcriptional regulator [Effusibacillus dendaii]BCJ86925.1 GntR family transcriptional regulator [Effusibacillus dendaii]